MKILVVLDYYLPGYKGGGPIRTIANMVEWLGNDFDFYILTSDRDLGDTQPYPGIEYGTWHQVGNAQVHYLSPKQRVIVSLKSIMKGVEPDLVYVNSFFSPMCVMAIWTRFLRRTSRIPFLLAPRDELAPQRLKLKRLKKAGYLRLIKLLGVYHGVIWQATNEQEREAIRSHFSRSRVLLARNMAAKSPPQINPIQDKGQPLRVIFLSRISRSKNLSYALRILQKVQTPVLFDIYGPQEDPAYWVECEQLMGRLPDHIAVRYKGLVMPDTVLSIFAGYDAFLFPSLAENYGHVIWEALYAGCLPIISDRTPWQNIPGWVHSLDSPEQFAASLDELAAMSPLIYQKQRTAAHQHALQHAHNTVIVSENKALFEQTLEG